MDLASLADFVLANRPFASVVHGLEHWRQVEFNGLLLAPETGADPAIVRLFALFHDSKRLNDGADPEHGPRGAEFAEECLRAGRFAMDGKRFQQLRHACLNHTRELHSGDPTIDTCYDADRLDLCRVGIRPNPRKMATPFGRHLAALAQTRKIPLDSIRPWLHTWRHDG